MNESFILFCVFWNDMIIKNTRAGEWEKCTGESERECCLENAFRANLVKYF